MNLREQIKQTVMNLAYKVELALHRLRTDHEEREEKPEAPSKDNPSQVRTYYNNSKEERKLH